LQILAENPIVKIMVGPLTNERDGIPWQFRVLAGAFSATLSLPQRPRRNGLPAFGRLLDLAGRPIDLV
jgi:hypothetical protein